MDPITLIAGAAAVSQPASIIVGAAADLGVTGAIGAVSGAVAALEGIHEVVTLGKRAYSAISNLGDDIRELYPTPKSMKKAKTNQRPIFERASKFNINGIQMGKSSVAIPQPGDVGTVTLGTVFSRQRLKEEAVGKTATYIDIRSGTVIGNAGQQQFSNPLIWGCSTQWLANVTNPTKWTSAVAYMNNDSNSLVYGNYINNAAGFTQPIGQELILQRVKVDLTMTSAASIPVRMKLYWITPSKAPHAFHPDTILSTWSNWGKNAYTTAAQVDPTPGQHESTPGYLSMDMIGMHPNQCPEFKEYWKIISTDDVLLNVGSEIDIKKTLNLGQVGDRRELSEMVGGTSPDGSPGTTSYYIKGTVCLLMVQYGGLVLDKTAGYDFNGMPTTGSTKVMWLSRAVHTFQKKKFTLHQEQTLVGNQNVPVGAALADQKDLGTAYTVQGVTEM